MENIIFSPLSVGDFEKLVTKSVEDALVRIQENQNKNVSEIVDGDYLCNKLNITRQTLACWRKKKLIPFTQVGQVIRYDFNEVIQSLGLTNKGGKR
ncbi:helix-turn-helix domain-containing protein [Pedobacter lithocola]|uniref:Helix-turn-helix domain-containing protein n=2 Tax=Pedobacter TaxID=84567 RepID=A0ABV8NJI8_9SPHI